MKRKRESSKKSLVVLKTPLQRQQSQLYKLKKEFKLMKKHIESKALTISANSSNVEATTGAMGSLMTYCIQGLNNSERIGNRINILSIQYTAWVYQLSSTLGGMGSFDIILDRNPTGTLPTITSIYFSGAPDEPLLFNKKLSRFKRIAHHSFAYGTGSIDSIGQVFEGYRKINLETIYTGNVGNITDLTSGKNDLLYVFRSTNTSAGNVSYGCVGNFRIVFKDA